MMAGVGWRFNKLLLARSLLFYFSAHNHMCVCVFVFVCVRVYGDVSEAVALIAASCVKLKCCY